MASTGPPGPLKADSSGCVGTENLSQPFREQIRPSVSSRHFIWCIVFLRRPRSQHPTCNQTAKACDKFSWSGAPIESLADRAAPAGRE
ncbi:hypothetical protein RRG08_053578 [Elysia crispata]|uniref:Uncharacterized protein n=1 Tax=Elysia crispata TaxID=231223 RepID=A0AAE1CQR5_9GAST|nr:hypothetical protein RRG08_053578 [Elysia crispata]